MVKKPANTGKANATRDRVTRKGKLRRQSEEIDMIDTEMVDGASDPVEESQESQPQLQAILKAVETEDTSKAQSRATAITRKVSGFADTAHKDIEALRAEAAQMIAHVESQIARMRGEEVEPDWMQACRSFGDQARNAKVVIAAYDTVLETNGPVRSNIIGDITDALDQNPRIRFKSRKKLMKHAQRHLERGLENQKTATDAKALIKGYKNLLRVSSGHPAEP
ncbi:hypothetical protein FRB90_006111 [Tulasnella sp. 427]|nr:hypothetical protein FRB90_006111 [Tulasnella sp. 427]